MKVFLDTNILVYAQQSGSKAEAAKELVAQGGTISVQVLNELANVLRRDLRRDWQDVEAVIEDVRDALDAPLPLTVESHSTAVRLARDNQLSVYDALIVASALEAECDTLYSEDMQHGRVFAGLTVRNPFIQGPRRPQRS